MPQSLSGLASLNRHPVRAQPLVYRAHFALGFLVPRIEWSHSQVRLERLAANILDAWIGSCFKQRQHAVKLHACCCVMQRGFSERIGNVRVSPGFLWLMDGELEIGAWAWVANPRRLS